MEIINKLKPVVFVKGEYGYTAQNTTQQIMLLRALKITQDPKKLREIHPNTIIPIKGGIVILDIIGLILIAGINRNFSYLFLNVLLNSSITLLRAGSMVSVIAFSLCNSSNTCAPEERR